MQNMPIRRLDESDAENYREIRLEGLQNHPASFGASFDEEAALPISLFAERLGERTVFGADAGDVLLGIIGLTRGHSAKSRHIATIWGMYVRPAARGSGLSARLLDTAVASARQDARSVRLSVVASNLAALRLYRKAGFRPWARDGKALYVNGRFHDEILMRRDFD